MTQGQDASRGALRLDLLDPSISPLQRRRATSPYVASQGALARSSQRLWDYLHPRQRARVGAHLAGLLKQETPRIDSVQEDLVHTPEPVPAEKIEQLQHPEAGLRKITERPFDHEVYQQTQECSPQFFLRNVKRVTNSSDMFGRLFTVEVWRDPAQYKVEVGRGAALTWAPLALEDLSLWRLVEEATASRKAVINDIDWSEHRGRWKEGITRMSFFEQMGFLFETQRGEGRFAVDEDKVASSRKAVEEQRRRGAEEIARRDAEQTGAETKLSPEASKANLPDKYKDLPDHILKMIGLMD